MTDREIDISKKDDLDINNIEKESELESNLEILFYKKELLHIQDDKIIDKNLINKTSNELINNYNSDEYENYLKILTMIPKKFIKKNFKVEYLGNKITINQVLKDGKIKELHEIKCPKYCNILEECTKLVDEIKYKRSQLLNNYNSLLLSDSIVPLDKNKFIEKKKDFLDLLHKYYSYRKYYTFINNLNLDDKKKILLYNLIENKNNSNDIIIDLLENNDYYIKNDTINEINIMKLNKLNLYNDILSELKDLGDNKINKELKDKIIDYLNSDNEKEINKLLEYDINITNKIIKIAVLEKPEISNIEKLL